MDQVFERLRVRLREIGARSLDNPRHAPLSRFAVGDYVAVWEGHRVKADPFTLNYKFSTDRWSGPWRVVQMVRGVSLMLTWGCDPLRVRYVSGMQVKPYPLEPQARAEMDALYDNTLAFKEKEIKRLQLVEDQRVQFQYDWAPDVDRMQTIKRIVACRGHGRTREVRCEWEEDDGSTTLQWEPLQQIAEDVHELWAEFKKKNAADAGKRARRGV